MSNGVTFYFMRHAETYLNRLERVQGWANAPLTDRGIEDARRSGRGLADVQFKAVYTSDLARTVDTANIILGLNRHADRLQIETMPEFREVHFGFYEGLDATDLWRQIIHQMRTVYQIESDYQKHAELFLNIVKELDPYKYAENYLEFWMRVENGLLQLLNRHAGTNDNVLIVSHGLTIHNLLHGLVADFDHYDRLINASVSKVRYEDGQFKLLTFNDTSHFID